MYNTTNEGVISIDTSTDDGAEHGLHVIGGSGDAKATLDVVVTTQWLMGGQVA